MTSAWVWGTRMVCALGFYLWCLFPPGTDSEACPDHHGETSQDCEQDGHFHGPGFRTHCKCPETQACVFPRRPCSPHTSHITPLLSTGTRTFFLEKQSILIFPQFQSICRERGNYPFIVSETKTFGAGILVSPTFCQRCVFSTKTSLFWWFLSLYLC